MSNPKYINIGSNSVKLMEECSELIQAVCKIERFGNTSYYERSNLQRLEDEWEDVKYAYNEYMKEITQEGIND